MEYITGQYALNLSCSLNTTGDWHTSALNWKNVYTLFGRLSAIGVDYYGIVG